MLQSNVMKRFIVAFLAILHAVCCIAGIVTEHHYLSGYDKDTMVEWDFMCSSGRNSGIWSKIKVPACWETQGFGTYYYGWEEPRNSMETGHYRHRFVADKSWRDKHVEIVFEGVMTDTEVRINGMKAGNIHEGGFYRFKYDVTDLLKYGKENILEVDVRKCPADSSVFRAERQSDFWLFGGIYRPVYLEIKPRHHIDGISVDAKADGSLAVKPYLSDGCRVGDVQVYVESLDGKRLSKPVCETDADVIRTLIKGVSPWSHEHPVLYRLVAELYDKDRIIHRVTENIGFRTVEFREHDGIYLNGERIIFKGVNRHCFWPESGRTLSRSVSLMDAELIKSMNMNAVRMSHYPPDKEFLEICDSIGLLVIDELCGWQKRYDTSVARPLVRSVVERDRNHPSVILWANGNEGGWNREVDDDYGVYDLQERLVIHPWERYRGTDTKHYPDYNYVVNSAIYDQDVYFPTEFMHGIFDGGAGASLGDFWDVMMRHRAPAGGFLWALIDEGLVRSDMCDSIDCRRDQAPDGILGPYREKEGSYYAIKEIWSPVRIMNRVIPAGGGVTLRVENNYMFTHLSECDFTYGLWDIKRNADGTYSETLADSGVVESPDCAPGERRNIVLDLPEDWCDHNKLSVTIKDSYGNEVYTYSWAIGAGNDMCRQLLGIPREFPVDVSVSDGNIAIHQGDNIYSFDCKSGMLIGIDTPEGHVSLHGGPLVTPVVGVFRELRHYRDGDNYVVEPVMEGGQWIKWVFSPAEPPRIDYSFSMQGENDYFGIGFMYPESNITGMDWVGDGPYRVWKNRLQGAVFGVHAKEYNNTVTGESWTYPEFKGFHADCRAVTVHTTEKDITFIPAGSGLFFQMLAPQPPAHDGNGFTMPDFPETSLGFMHAIPPVGTKFQSPLQLGPSGMKNMQLNWTPVSGSLWIII